MSRILPLSVAVVLLVSACGESGTAPRSLPVKAHQDVSDGRAGSLSERNPHFFWLPPILPQPAQALLGQFMAQASPTVAIVCQSTNQQVANCDGKTALATFNKGTGLTVGTDLFQVDFDTRAYTLNTTSADHTSFTTYRVIVKTEALTDVGGPFVLGYADFEVVEGGKAAKNTATGEMIGLVDGRTLPIKFRIDRGAYEWALKDNLARHPDDPNDAALCQVNCSVTVIPADQTTTATLADDNTGIEVTAMQFQPGDVTTTSVLIIDERTTDGSNAECAVGINVAKKYCYRYEIVPRVSFTQPVRFGICPRELVNDPNPWRLLKVDYANGKATAAWPPIADVSDFLPCTQPVGLLRKFARFAFDWLVPVANAATTPRPWGGMAGDLSDLLWASALPTTVQVTPAAPDSLDIGGTLQLTATALDVTGQPVPAAIVNWSTSDAQVASVSATGLVAGVAAGNATISATSGAATGSVQVVVRPPAVGLPDLWVSSVVLGTNQANRGDSISVTYTVANAGGDGPAGNSVFAVALYLSSDMALSPDDISLGQGGYTSWAYHLSPGWSQTVTLTGVRIPQTVPGGTYYVIVVADDSPGQPPNYYPGVTESSENNNTRASGPLTVF